MEYIDGEDLASLLRRVGRISPPKALEIARQLVAGLAAAHDRGLLHRDLKPANVMVDGQGRARITDFGLSLRLADELKPARSGQAAGAAHGVVDFAGTTAYMAPERFAGQPATIQSDLYALGLTLYETCTGQAALHSTTIEGWKRAHSDSVPTAPSAVVTEIDRALERAILWCLEKDPARRPASAATLAAALPGGDPLAAMIAAGETPSPELVAASGEEGTLPRGRAWALFGAVVVALIFVVVGQASVTLNNLVPMKSPDAQVDTARELLKALGHDAPMRDSIWWMTADVVYLENLPARGTARTLFTLPARDVPGPVRFCCRQSPRPIFSTAFPLVSAIVQLRVVPSQEPATTGAVPDWDPLFHAARCEPRDFARTTPSLLPADRYDLVAEWAGTCNGQPARVTAAAVGGRATSFQMRSSRAAQTRTGTDEGFSSPFVVVTLTYLQLLPAIVFAAFAWRNVRAGRGDRRGGVAARGVDVRR
jgi:hypothetical protein